MITFDDFSKLKLQTGKVLEVEAHPNADRLYVLKVDIGQETIQLVAGLKAHYQPEELKGRNVVILVNLEPKSLRGVDSCGMLLAAQSEGQVRIISPDGDLPAGSLVK